MAKTKSKKAKTLTWSNIYARENEVFQQTIKGFTVTNPLGLDQLVSNHNVKKYIYKLIEGMEDYTLDDVENDIHIKVYLEQYSYNSRTQRGIAKIAIQSFYPGKGKGEEKTEMSKTIFKSIDCSVDDNAKVCALTIFSDLLDTVSTAGSNEYRDVLNNMGIELTSYYD